MGELRGLLGKLSGLDLASADVGVSFVELGFDSLSLVQVSRSIELKYGVSVAFRELLESFKSLDQLAAQLDRVISGKQTEGGLREVRHNCTAAEAGRSVGVEGSQGEKVVVSVVPKPDANQQDSRLKESRGATSAIGDSQPAAEQDPLWLKTKAMQFPQEQGPKPPGEPASPPVGAPGVPSNRDTSKSPSADHMVVPLTEGQKELWFASAMGAEASAAFNLSNVVRMRGPFLLGAMQQAVQALVNRHEALRATFLPTGDAQLIASRMILEVPLHDLSRLPEPEQQKRLDDVLAASAQAPFDLGRGPLIRADLVRLAADDHLLALTAHHLVADGRAWNVMIEELGELYVAECEGRDSDLPAAPRFSVYAQEQAAQETGPQHARAERYWLDQLKEHPPLLELPADKARPKIRSFRGAIEKLVLDSELCRDLKRVSASQSCTLLTTVLTAFLTLLHRLSGQNDIVLGLPTGDRTFQGGESLVGHCVRFLPLRVKLDETELFRDFQNKVKGFFLEAYDHRHCGFGSLIQKLNLPRDMSRPLLTSATFTSAKLRPWPERFGLKMSLDANPWMLHQFDIALDGLETNGEIQFDLHYNPDLFEPSTIRRWLDYLQTLLKAIVADIARRVDEMPILPEAEQHRMLVEWNNTTLDYPRDLCLHQLFEAQAERTPDATALLWNEERLSYAQLECRSNQLAHHLISLGVGPESLVGIYLNRTPSVLVAILGVLKAGAAYVPLDPAYPKQRIKFILEDTRAALLLTESALLDDAKSLGASCRFLSLDADWSTISSRATNPPETGVRPANLAYVIYTSGSTGQPKGVAIEHRSPVMFIHWARQVFTREQLAGVMFSTSICFDVSIFEMFATLSCGGTLILADNGLHLSSLPAREQVTLVSLVPSVLAEILRLGALPGSVRTVVCAGEPLSVDTVRRAYEQPHVEKVYDLYGPTETTVYSTCALRHPEASATIGRPIANTQIYLLDSNLQPVPIGVPGQIFIGGDGLARGYLNRPELTAEKFVPNPFAAQTQARLYKTGDLARYRVDGSIEFLGRIDHQVKIRGFRIELGEIESVLRQQPSVAEAVVIAREDVPGDKRLVAYVVLRRRTETEESVSRSLRDALSIRLPEFMLPSAIVVLDQFALLANGKVNRSALPAPDPARLDAANAKIEPETPTQQILARIWCEVLGVERVGLHDNFFHLGGHSLLATRLTMRVRETLEIQLPLRTVFELPRLDAMASLIEDRLVEDIQRQVA